jgi:chromosome segregation ATPase
MQIMKEKLRKYKARTSTLEQQVSQKNNQIVVLEDTINTLKQQLAVSVERGGQKDERQASTSEASSTHCMKINALCSSSVPCSPALAPQLMFRGSSSSRTTCTRRSARLR